MNQSNSPTPESWTVRVRSMRELGVIRMKFNDGMEIELAPAAPVVEVEQAAPEPEPIVPVMHPNRKRRRK